MIDRKYDYVGIEKTFWEKFYHWLWKMEWQFQSLTEPEDIVERVRVSRITGVATHVYHEYQRSKAIDEALEETSIGDKNVDVENDGSVGDNERGNLELEEFEVGESERIGNI